MIPYAITLFLLSVAFMVVSILIYRGRTDLIHDYHQTKVKDQAAYGRAFGKAFSLFGITMAVSAIVSLLGEPAQTAVPAVALLILGLILSTARILAVQKKFNEGLF